jgi:peptide/nickel transport system ATP-binding protein
MVFVTHDLRVAAQLCDRVIVMSKGEIAEAGLTSEVFSNPRHPYTQHLLASIPGRQWTPPHIDSFL